MHYLNSLFLNREKNREIDDAKKAETSESQTDIDIKIKQCKLIIASITDEEKGEKHLYWTYEENKFREFIRNPLMKNKIELSLDGRYFVDSARSSTKISSTLSLKSFHNNYESQLIEKLDSNISIKTTKEKSSTIDIRVLPAKLNVSHWDFDLLQRGLSDINFIVDNIVSFYAKGKDAKQNAKLPTGEPSVPQISKKCITVQVFFQKLEIISRLIL